MSISDELAAKDAVIRKLLDEKNAQADLVKKQRDIIAQYLVLDIEDFLAEAREEAAAAAAEEYGSEANRSTVFYILSLSLSLLPSPSSTQHTYTHKQRRPYTKKIKHLQTNTLPPFFSSLHPVLQMAQNPLRPLRRRLDPQTRTLPAALPVGAMGHKPLRPAPLVVRHDHGPPLGLARRQRRLRILRGRARKRQRPPRKAVQSCPRLHSANCAVPSLLVSASFCAVLKHEEMCARNKKNLQCTFG
jgi:hypothetical protein